MPYSGIPTVLVGYPSQISPVGGSSGWISKTSSVNGVVKQGHNDYMPITTVIKLAGVMRRHGVYMELLLGQRNGKTAVDD